MAIIDIYSENPDISWVIYKNPETQKSNNKPFEKAIRQGKAISWYTNEQHFRTLFKEGKNAHSFYKNLNNNYLDQSAYNCPYVYCAVINDIFSATTKKCHEKDTIFFNKVSISAIQINLPKIMDFFIHFFENKIKIKATKLGSKIYSIDFEGNQSLHYILNLVQVFCLIQAIEDKNIYIDLSNNLLTKYINSLQLIEAPYFIFYLFNSRCIPHYDNFKALESYIQRPNWILQFGNTQRQRYQSIKAYIQGGNILHDIGCGELYYTRQFSPKYQTVFAWDTDSNIQERNSRFIEKQNLFNVQLKDTFDSEQIKNIESNCDILITEMLEHIPKDNAISLLNKISTVSFRRLIITVPNRDFNNFYQLGQEFRHDDHKWEPNFDEIRDIIENIFPNKQFNVIIKPIGDLVNNISVSTLIVIDKI